MIRVVVADDSPTFRRFLRYALEAEGDIQVVADVDDGPSAARMVAVVSPDVLVLDLLMPGGGLNALRQVMKQRPLPVVVVTATVHPGDRTAAMEALSQGAVEVLPKPRAGEFAPAVATAMRRAVRGAAMVRREALAVPGGQGDQLGACEGPAGRVRVVGLAASTGGPPALTQVLRALDPARCPPLLVVQHIAREVEDALRDWMRSETRLDVRFAEDGEVPQGGRVYLCRQGRHLALRGECLRLEEGSPVEGFTPSANVLFRSLALHGAAAVGVVLTGMGADGADGLRAMREAGASTYAQSAASCVVYGMPRAAVERGAVCAALGLDAIAALLGSLSSLGAPA